MFFLSFQKQKQMTKDFFFDNLCGLVEDEKRETKIVLEAEDNNFCIYIKYTRCYLKSKRKKYGYRRVKGGKGSTDSEHAQKTFLKYSRWFGDYVKKYINKS